MLEYVEVGDTVRFSDGHTQEVTFVFGSIRQRELGFTHFPKTTYNIETGEEVGNPSHRIVEVVKKKKTTDSVNSPSHYTSGNIEVFDYIMDQGLGFPLGNAVKYISRAGKKNPDKKIEDLEKAVWYLQKQIEIWKKGEA